MPSTSLPSSALWSGRACRLAAPTPPHQHGVRPRSRHRPGQPEFSGRSFGGVGAHEAAPAGAAGDVDDRIGSVDVINPPALDDVVGFVSPAGRAGVDVGAELAPKPRGSLRCRAGMARSERKGA
ncbi:unnamed protein product [Prorocentrum cordatum]|uniref:Uncharacterized protein n=1 Tax=Prorocentrum cordatum TaxID=2364126 RepID=A0ABN9PK42_9DINO|nr:unnamed protein product [Polarella glacialis]